LFVIKTDGLTKNYFLLVLNSSKKKTIEPGLFGQLVHCSRFVHF